MSNKARIETSVYREHGSLEAAVSDLLARFSKVLSASELCRVGPKQLSAYANPNMPTRHMPIDVLLDLERSAKDPVVTRFLANSQDWMMFPLPTKFSESIWDQHLREVVKEGSEVFVELANALDDNRLSRNEAIAVLTEVDEALSAFGALRNSLKARIAKGSVAVEANRGS